MQYTRSLIVMFIISHSYIVFAEDAVYKKRASVEPHLLLKKHAHANKTPIEKEYQNLERRIRLIEQKLAFDTEPFAQGQARTKSALLEKIESFLAELREMRKDVFAKLREVRQEVKNHSGEIKEYKEKFDTLSDMLGSPDILVTISNGAEKLFTIVVALNNRIEDLELLVKELRDKSDEQAQDDLVVEKCVACLEMQEENERNKALVCMLELRVHQHEDAINRLMALEQKHFQDEAAQDEATQDEATQDEATQDEATQDEEGSQ